jgi:hypothetical protein
MLIPSTLHPVFGVGVGTGFDTCAKQVEFKSVKNKVKEIKEINFICVTLM